MKTIACMAGLAAVLWLLAGAQMIVTAEDGDAAVWGAVVSFVGVALAVLYVWSLARAARR